MKNLQIKTLFLFLTICILSCNSNKKIERENEPTIYNVEENDVEMNRAIEKAKQTIDSFDNAFKNNSRVFTFFGLKKKFEENGNVEHIWIGNIQGIEKGKYVGVIDNLPEKIKAVKLGDTVQIDRKEISDWMYIKNSELHGGYTIRLLRERMTEDERKKFDAESGMKIK
jgi:uncharacterized protein YegJ (DUF2314 family)